MSDDFVLGFLVAVVTIAGLVVTWMAWPEIAAGTRRALAWAGRGLRNFAQGISDIFDPPPVVLPRWAQRIAERFRR